MAFRHERLNVYQRMLSFNVKVAIRTGAWGSKDAPLTSYPALREAL